MKTADSNQFVNTMVQGARYSLIRFRGLIYTVLLEIFTFI